MSASPRQWGVGCSRNHQLTGKAVVSSIQDYNLRCCWVAGAIAEERGEQREAVAERLYHGPEPFVFDQVSVRPPEVDRASVSSTPRSTSIWRRRERHAGAGRLLFGPGTAALNRLLFDGLAETERWVSSVLLAGLAIMYFGLLAGIALLIVQRRADLLIPIGAIAIYLVLVSSGPPAYTQFRAPVMPFFAVVAGYGYAHRADVRTASIGFFRR